MRLARSGLAALLMLGAPAWAAPGDALVVAEENVNVRGGPGLEAPVVMRVHRDQLVIEVERQGDWVRGEIAGTGRRDGWIHGSLLARPGGQRVAAPLRPTAAPPVQQAEAPSEPEQAAAPTEPEPEPEVASRPAPRPAPPEPATDAGDLPPEAGELAREARTLTRDAAAGPSTGRAPTIAPQPADGNGPVGVAAAAPRAEPGPDAVAEPAPAAGPAGGGLSGIERFRENVSYLNGRALEVAGIELFTGVEAVSGDVVRVHATEEWSNVPPAGQESFLNTLLDRWKAAKGGGPARVQIANVLGEVVIEKSGP